MADQDTSEDPRTPQAKARSDQLAQKRDDLMAQILQAAWTFRTPK
ncbi:hypothetical protein ACWF94_12975 [Streptomyces sp. NPDC055078]